MHDRWTAEKERLKSLRIEYTALFTHLHFLQILRFGMLGGMLPIMAGMLSYYRDALPFTQYSLPLRSNASSQEALIAIAVAVLGWILLYTLYSIERGIRLQAQKIAKRGSVIESELSIVSGAFTALHQRFNSLSINRLSVILLIGYVFSTCIILLLIGTGLWVLLR